MKNVVLKIKTINKIENSSNRYDIEVKNNKNFFADNILVHNTKLSLVRNSEPYNTDYRKNWIVSYKNNIIYSTEFDGIENGEGSIGTSQYKIVHDHLKKVHPNTKGISENTEFFIEYLMAKPTLTRDYTTKNGMVLLAYSPTSIQVQHGMIKTQPEGFHTEDREQYAQMLGMKVPKVVYTGVLKDISPSKGTPTEVLADIKRRLLNVESEFGGKTEGVVIEMPDGTLYKFLQDDQHDKETRMANKMKYKSDSFDDENAYWQSIRKIAIPLANKLPKDNLKSSLQLLSKVIYSKDNQIKHSKKKGIQIKDDLFLTTKMILIKGLEGNNGAIFIGRFSPPTKAHMQIVENAYKRYDTVTLNIVKSGKNDPSNPFPIDLQMQMWQTVFPNLEIQISQTGNIITIINKADNNINAVLAGTDRKDGYEKQLARMPDVTVDEIQRTDEDISASKVRQALKDDDVQTFKQMMHPKTYQFYDELKQYV